MAVVVGLNRDDLRHAWVAWLLVGLAFAVTVVATLAATTRPERLTSPPFVLAELALGALLQFGGGWAYRGDPFSSSHAIGSAWPLAGVLTAGAVWGAVRTGALGGVIGACRILQPVTAGIALGDVERSQWFSIASTIILYLLAGAISGHVSDLMRRLERDISTARARDEVARTLHDGVLQTLAIIERRSDDPQLARLAREQDRELRAYLAGSHAATAPTLEPRLRAVAARFEDRFEARASIVVAPDLVEPDAAGTDALCGAVGEALANAGRHGGATSTTIYVEPDGESGLVCSVRDNGIGFDGAVTKEGMGIRESIRARLAEIGGHVEIDSRPGHGTEVRLWLPHVATRSTSSR